MKVIYTGSSPIKIRLQDKKEMKLKQNDVIEISDFDYNCLNIMGNFTVIESEVEVTISDDRFDIEEVEVPKKAKKKKKGGK